MNDGQALFAVVLVLLFESVLVNGQSAPPVQLQRLAPLQTNPRGLRRAIQELNQMHGWSVCYEEPLWKDSEVGDYLWPKLYDGRPLGSLRKLKEDNIDGVVLAQGLTKSSPIEALPIILSAYKAGGNKGAFTILESTAHICVVPDMKANQKSLMDTSLFIGRSTVTPGEAFTSLTDALSSATGIKISIDAAGFSTAWPMLFTPSIPVVGAVVKPVSFEWGSEGSTAREALIELLGHANSTVIWQFCCAPGDADSRTCVLSLSPRSIKVTGSDGIAQTKYFLGDRNKQGGADQLSRPARSVK